MGHVIAFRRMSDANNHRRGPDRRSTKRGGRRDGDRSGYAPLVLLVDDNEDSNARCEAILAKLHFAVAPTRSIDEASRVMDALRPDIIVARIADAADTPQGDRGRSPHRAARRRPARSRGPGRRRYGGSSGRISRNSSVVSRRSSVTVLSLSRQSTSTVDQSGRQSQRHSGGTHIPNPVDALSRSA